MDKRTKRPRIFQALSLAFVAIPAESFSSGAFATRRPREVHPPRRSRRRTLPSKPPPSVRLSSKNSPEDSSAVSSLLTAATTPIESVRTAIGLQARRFETARADGFGTRTRNAAFNATVGDTLVPLVSDLDQRQLLANRGIYAGVEYEICDLRLGNDATATTEVRSLEGLDREAKEGTVARVRPAYPLRDYLERDDWPVEVRLLEDVPLWVSKFTYEAGTAVGTLAVSSSFLLLASVVAFFVRLVAVPTPSMLPALQPGTVVLVTRSVSIGPLKPAVGDVVFFDAPSELEASISKWMSSASSPDAAANANGAAGGAEEWELLSPSSSSLAPTKGRQFVKRVVALPGESVGVKQSSPYVRLSETRYRFDVVGPYARPELFPPSSWDRPPVELSQGEYFVAGDNGYRSVDSRVWGPLPQRCIIGTAKWIVWPPREFGRIPAGPIAEVAKPAAAGPPLQQTPPERAIAIETTTLGRE